MPMTSWKKSAGEIRKIEERLAAPAFLEGRFLTLTYLTRPEIVQEVLPPPLEPGSEPLVSVAVGHMGRSNCVGEFSASALLVRARYRELEGDYCLAMPMSTDVAIIFGRELFGEPKKQARIGFERDGDFVRGTIERYGITFATLEARVTEEIAVTGPITTDRFHYKFLHAADGRGLEFDPILVHVRFTSKLRRMRRGEGKLALAPSRHDPLSEIELVEPRGAVYTEGDLYAEAKRIATVDAERFLPYAFQNIDDYTSV